MNMQKFFMGFFVVTFGVAISFSAVKGDVGGVNGKVIDSSTGEPLPAAHIIIEGTKIGDVTDKNGAYSIENIPPGNYVLKASFIGYRTATAKITLSVNESVNQNFDLKPEAISVASLVVEAETELPTERNVINYAGARNVMDVAAIRKTAAAYTEEILKTVPGIYYQDETGTGSKPNVGVRGIDPRRSQWVAILIDDVPIEVGPYGHTGLSLFPYTSERTQQIDVLRGGVAVRHGPNTVGGVINILTRTIPSVPTLTIEQSGGTDKYWSNNLSYGGRWGKTGVLTQFVSKVGDGFRENNQFKMFNYNLKLNHEFSSTSLLELSFDGYNEPDVDLPGGLSPTGFEEDFRQSEHPNDFFDGYRYGGNIKFYKQINANQRLRILGYGHKAFRNFGLDRSGGTVIRETPRKFWVYAFEPQYSVKFNSSSVNQTLTLGARALIEDANFNRPQYSIDENGNQVGQATNLRETDFKATTFSFYIDDKIQFSDRFSLYPGLRIERVKLEADRPIVNDAPSDLSAEQDFTEFLPGISGNLHANENLVFFGNFHRAFRAPQYFQIEVSDTRKEFQDFTAERSFNTELGTRIGPVSGFYGEITVFNIEFNDRVERDPETENVYRNIGATKHRGAESRLALALGAWDPSLKGLELSGSYTYVDSEVDDGEFKGNDAPKAPKHRFYWRVSYDARGGISFVVDGIHISTSFQDAANTAEENANGTNGPLPRYDIVNAGISYTHPRLNFTIFGHVKNIFEDVYFHRDFRGRMPGPDRTFIVGFRKDFSWTR